MSKKKTSYHHKPLSPYFALQKLQKDSHELSLKIEAQGEKIEKLEHQKRALSESHSTYISMLANFASHDLKNAIQSMDTILYTNSLDELTPEHIDALQANLTMMRESMNNFSQLAPHSEDSLINIQNLITTVISINRDVLKKENISYDIEHEVTITFRAAFHALAGSINNILINAIKALSNSNTKDKKIKITYGYNEQDLYPSIWFKIYDNADEIPIDILDQIFDYGFTTKNEGSGIGLYHVRDICNQYKGTIDHLESDLPNYTKCFHIQIPVSKENHV